MSGDQRHCRAGPADAGACIFDRLIGCHLVCRVFARYLGKIRAQRIMLTQVSAAAGGH